MAETPSRKSRKPRTSKKAAAPARRKPSAAPPRAKVEAKPRRRTAAKPARVPARGSSGRSPEKPPLRLTRKMIERLLTLEEVLSNRIVGKNEAIDRIARVIRVRLSQLEMRPERPRGMFFLVGPSGVGKSEFAYALSEALYGDEEHLVSIDLDEFEEEESLQRIGSALIPGPENLLIEGMLTTPVREQPDRILLLRGLERAHPIFQRILLQIMERGVFEDMLGPVSFHRTIIFVTSSLRREDLPPTGIGFARASRAPSELLRERLERLFLGDLLDAFDEILELPALNGPDVRRIARYKVNKVLARMNARHKQIVVSEEVYETLIPDDLCRQQGAAFLNRTLEDRLFNPLARYILSHRRSVPLQVGLEAGQVVIREQEKRAGR